MDLAKYRSLPTKLMAGGAVVGIIGLLVSLSHDKGVNFMFSYLVAFMFVLSLGLGGLALVIIHHLFDAGWSVPIRRVAEHLAGLLFPWIFFLFLPIALVPTKLFEWMRLAKAHTPDHALTAKAPLFTMPGFYIVSFGCFLVWGLLSNRLKFWSLKQDETGGADCTYKMRFHASWGVWGFAFSLTFAAIMWMKALHHEWFSTMYGVQYWAGSVWLTLATVYLITMILDRQKIISEVLHEHQYYFLGSIFFAFTVFYAYVTFAQYFIIWNANMPEETFWYVLREKGSWFLVAMVIIFGHFFVPFLGLLRIDLKSNFRYMMFMVVWAWAMHFNDMCFNVLPANKNFAEGFPFAWAWLPLGILAFMVGLLMNRFLKSFASAAPFPVKDPRLMEAMGLYHPVATPISGGEMDQAHQLRGAPKGGH